MEKERLTQIVTAFAGGDQDAFSDIYEMTRQNFYVYARKLVSEKGGAADAEDILHDTYMEICRCIGTLKDPGAFTTWSKKILFNTAMQKLRREGREVLTFDGGEEEGRTDFFDMQENTDEEYIPGAELDKREVCQIVMETIDTLPPEQRMTVMAFYYDEMSVTEIAEAMECSEGTVKSRLFHGRQALKDRLESYERKHDIRLHSLVAMPLLTSLFREADTLLQLPEELSAKIFSELAAELSGAGAGGAGTSGSAASAEPAEAAGKAAAAAGKAAGTAAAGGVIGRIASVVLFLMITAGCAGAGYLYFWTDFSPLNLISGSEYVQVHGVKAEDLTVGQDVAGLLKPGDENWFRFVPEESGYYCFFTELGEAVQNEWIEYELYTPRVKDQFCVFAGLLSNGFTENELYMYFSNDGTLDRNKIYYIRVKLKKDQSIRSFTLLNTEAGYDHEVFDM